jgi:hypothetical protein
MGLERRDRTSVRSGKTTSRYSFSIKTEPVLFDLSPNRLGMGPAHAIRDFLSAKIRDIGEVAKPSTLKRRQEARARFDAGDSRAMKRYSGGRTGPTPPAQSVRMFNDSGRFGQNLEVRPNTSNAPGSAAYTINVPANRLDPSTFIGGEAALAAMYQRLVALVPEIGDAKKLMAVPSIRKAIADAVDTVLIQEYGAATARRKQLRSQLMRGYFGILRQLSSGFTFG